MKVRPFANSFEAAFQVSLLFEVIFAMLGHFFVVRRVACGVLFLSSTNMEASSTDANLFSLEARSKFTRHWTAGRTKTLSIQCIAISKKKRAKRRSWCIPGPLKRGQEHFSCPLLSGPGTLSTHHGRVWCFPALAQTSLVGQCHRNHHVTCGKWKCIEPWPCPSACPVNFYQAWCLLAISYRGCIWFSINFLSLKKKKKKKKNLIGTCHFSVPRPHDKKVDTLCQAGMPLIFLAATTLA